MTQIIPNQLLSFWMIRIFRVLIISSICLQSTITAIGAGGHIWPEEKNPHFIQHLKHISLWSANFCVWLLQYCFLTCIILTFEQIPASCTIRLGYTVISFLSTLAKNFDGNFSSNFVWYSTCIANFFKMASLRTISMSPTARPIWKMTKNVSRKIPY